MELNLIDKEKAKLTQADVIVNDSWKLFAELGKDEFYKRITGDAARDTIDPLQKSYHWLFDNYYNILKKQHILDAGCGIGPFVMKMEKRGHIVTGLDMYLSKIKFCNLIKRTYPAKRITFDAGTIYRMPYFGGWFDTCHSTMVIEHLQDPIFGLKEMARTAKVVTGIIHMGRNKDESLLHTWFMTKERIETNFDWLIKAKVFTTVNLAYIDTNICAVFIAESCETNSYCADIEVAKIRSAKSMLPELEDSYFEAIKLYGPQAAENSLFPIRVKRVDESKFVINGDGTHRVNALKRAGVKTIRGAIDGKGD